jgi:hypothetical protein
MTMMMTTMTTMTKEDVETAVLQRVSALPVILETTARTELIQAVHLTIATMEVPAQNCPLTCSRVLV